MEAKLLQKLLQTLSDDEVVQRVLAGEPAMFEILIRRHNQRIYRVARAVVKDEDEAEDVMQEAYVRAWRNLSRFEGRASFATWLTRIAVREALARRRRRQRQVPAGDLSREAEEEALFMSKSPNDSPEDRMSRREAQDLLTRSVDALPGPLRLVFTLREIEGLGTEETAQALGTTEANVKVRLHRARRRLREGLQSAFDEEARRLYAFHLFRCDRIVERVFRAMAEDKIAES